jgi:hypothetical protein
MHGDEIAGRGHDAELTAAAFAWRDSEPLR